MSTDTLAEQFRERLGERVLDTKIAYEQLTVTVAPDAFAQVARFCKQELGMTFFDCLSGVDEREDGFSVVARVYSHLTREDVLLKALAPGGRDHPRLPTLTGVYAGANWHEREAYDMFGIIFDGHPGLLPRILTVENFEGWPLRKEFRLASRDVKPWPGAKEPGGSDEEEGTAKPAASPTPGADPQDRAAAAKAKAERAKAKAAEARKRKAAERAAAEDTTGPEAAAGGSGGHPQEGTAAEEDTAAEESGEPVPPTRPEAETATEDAPSGDAEPGSTREAMAGAAGRPVPEGTPDATQPEGAAAIAGTAEAKDAAAGARDGDTATPAPGDPVEGDQPMHDPAGEASKGEGGDPAHQAAPGLQPEGTHDLETSTARSADVSDQPDPDDVASREAHGVGPGSTGTFAEPQQPQVPADSDEETEETDDE